MRGKTKCRSCGAEMIMARTIKGAWMPIDAEPVPDGSLVITTQKGGTMVRPMAPGEDAERRYVSHFATCPQAGAWRVKR